MSERHAEQFFVKSNTKSPRRGKSGMSLDRSPQNGVLKGGIDVAFLLLKRRYVKGMPAKRGAGPVQEWNSLTTMRLSFHLTVFSTFQGELEVNVGCEVKSM